MRQPLRCAGTRSPLSRCFPSLHGALKRVVMGEDEDIGSRLRSPYLGLAYDDAGVKTWQ